MLKTIDPISSMMNFNSRVLHTAKQYISDDPAELKKALFFVSVYQNNCDELFCRDSHASPTLVDAYRKNSDLYNEIVRDIILKMRANGMYCTQQIDSSVFLQMYPLMRFHSYTQMRANTFQTGWIYYVTLMNDRLKVQFLDPADVIYQRVFRNEDGSICKTDQAILQAFKTTDQCKSGVVFRVTTEADAPTMIHKVEWYGDEWIMEQLTKKYFRHSELIMENPFLYIGDLQLCLEEQIPAEVEQVIPSDLCMTDIMKQDRLVEYPRQSFGNYLDLLQEASVSSLVESICITLYRVGSDPTLLQVLKKAVSNGIEVNVHLELHASGEEINQLWLILLQDSGVNVYTYYPGQIKVHAKLTLITLKNGDQIAQIGTGNYHTKTTLQYTDLMLFTADEEICHEVMRVFHILMNDQRDHIPVGTSSLLVSRYNARDELIDMIDDEAEKGEDGLILFKMNALDDPEIIEHLALAEETGCRICLIIRGLCTWLPDGLDDNVEIRSMIWDKLEHSRVYSFGSENPRIYIGSMDLVQHKMDHRIETLCQIKDPDIILWMVNYLNRYATETDHVWFLQPDGTYKWKEEQDHV